MSKSLKITGLVVLGVFIGALIGTFGFAWKNAGVRGDKLRRTMDLIERQYVDKVNMDTLAEKVIPLILRELDPHSVYIPAEDLGEVNEPLEGEFDGIGVMFNMLTDTVVVLNVIPGGPSEKAGIQNGDRIIAIDDSLVAGQNVRQDAIVKMLRGPRGTKVDLSVERIGALDPLPITVERGVIPIRALDAAFMIEPGVGFVKLSAFSRFSAAELQKALLQLREQGMERLIFDLRGNGGGYLGVAIEMVNMLLPKGMLIVYTQDRAGRQTKEFSNGRGGFTQLPLVVMIDEESASSSEIVAGAIQDNDRGMIVGRRSFGKGLVQTEIDYADGSALRLTIARYYTPSGRSIQKPYDKGVEEYGRDLYNRYGSGEMFAQDSVKQDTVKYYTRAGRIVHGGGGIMPDYFVGVDTVGVTPYYQRVNGTNLIYRFTLEWGDRHRAEMNAVSSLEELRAMLAKYPHLVDEFVRYAQKLGVVAVATEIEKSRAVLDAQLRALIGRNTAVEDAGFYDNIYVIDSTVLKALEVVKKIE